MMIIMSKVRNGSLPGHKKTANLEEMKMELVILIMVLLLLLLREQRR